MFLLKGKKKSLNNQNNLLTAMNKLKNDVRTYVKLLKMKQKRLFIYSSTPNRQYQQEI